MAITFDANLGSTSENNPGTTTPLTTAAAAAANTRIVVIVSYWAGGGGAGAIVSGVNDGSAYTLDKRVTNGSDMLEIWSRYATGGLSSGSTITVTYSKNPTGGSLVGAASFTGLESGASYLDTTTSNTTTGTSWSSGSATNAAADALFYGGAGNETASAATSTATSGTEIHDLRDSGAQQGFADGYTIASSIASRNIAGTWSSSSTATTGGLVIYKSAAAAAASLPELVMAPSIPT